MKMKKQFVIIFSMFLLAFALPLVSSEVVQNSEFSQQGITYLTNGYVIAPITINDGQIGEDLYINFRTYDSNGKVILTNDNSVNCSVFMFSTNGENIYRLDGNEKLDIISLTAKRGKINGSFFDEVGVYNWFVGCEGNVNGGWFQGQTEITEKDDRNLSFNLSKTENIIILILLIIISIVLLYYKQYLIVGFAWFVLSIMLMLSGANFIISLIVLIASLVFIFTNK